MKPWVLSLVSLGLLSLFSSGAVTATPDGGVPVPTEYTVPGAVEAGQVRLVPAFTVPPAKFYTPELRDAGIPVTGACTDSTFCKTIDVPEGTKVINCMVPAAHCKSDPKQDRLDFLSQVPHVKIVRTVKVGKKNTEVVSYGWMYASDLHATNWDIPAPHEEAGPQVVVDCCGKEDSINHTIPEAEEIKAKVSFLQGTYEGVCPAPRPCSFGGGACVGQTYSTDHMAFTLTRINAGVGASYFSFSSEDGKMLYMPQVRQVKSDTKNLCKVNFPFSCGATGSFYERATEIAGTLRIKNKNLCQAVTEQFYTECSAWKGVPPVKRKEFVLDKVRSAVDAFEITPGKKLFPGQRDDASPAPKMAKKASKSSLNAGIIQCLFHRENPNFEPSRLNYKQCENLAKGKQSSAIGIAQVTQNAMRDLFRRNQLQGYCEEFKKYFDKYNHPCEEGESAEEVFHRYSDDPYLQIALGIKVYNDFVQRAQGNVGVALENWLGGFGKEAFKCEVMACAQCMKSIGSNDPNRREREISCLPKTQVSCK